VCACERIYKSLDQIRLDYQKSLRLHFEKRLSKQHVAWPAFQSLAVCDLSPTAAFCHTSGSFVPSDLRMPTSFWVQFV
jgi:hypothetical protein